MKKDILPKALLALALVCAVFSLAAQSGIALIAATILMAICVLFSFTKKE